MSSKCIEESGNELNLNNQDIVKYLCSIKEERDNLEQIIQKQYEERKRTEAEIEKLTYKLCLINKSLSTRIRAKNNYDKTIDEIKTHYEKLVDSSNQLKRVVKKTQEDLDDIMNKKTGTEYTTGPEGEVKMIYSRSSNPNGSADDCNCDTRSNPHQEVPTKDTKPDTMTKPDNNTDQTSIQDRTSATDSPKEDSSIDIDSPYDFEQKETIIKSDQSDPNEDTKTSKSNTKESQLEEIPEEPRRFSSEEEPMRFSTEEERMMKQHAFKNKSTNLLLSRLTSSLNPVRKKSKLEGRASQIYKKSSKDGSINSIESDETVELN